MGRSSARWAYFGGTYADVARVRKWFLRQAPLQNGRGYWAELVVSELAANAVRHTATGERHGRMGVCVEFLGDRAVLLGVLDQGPRAGQAQVIPKLVAQEPDAVNLGGRGLCLVDRIAEYWWWEGRRGLPLHMRAIIRLDREPDLGESDLGSAG